MGAQDEFYQGSLMDISFNVECLLFFEEINRKNRYTSLNKFFCETIRLLKKEQQILLKRHLMEWDENVDVKYIRNIILDLGISTKEAISIANQITKTGIDLTHTEFDFVNNIISWKDSRLTKKQSEYLMSIYKRAIL